MFNTLMMAGFTLLMGSGVLFFLWIQKRQQAVQQGDDPGSANGLLFAALGVDAAGVVLIALGLM